jgi:hypothetical protein
VNCKPGFTVDKMTNKIEMFVCNVYVYL